jgi:hypothetical protein
MISLDTVSVVALTCFFCFLPVVFYSAAKFHGDSNNKKSSKLESTFINVLLDSKTNLSPLEVNKGVQ